MSIDKEYELKNYNAAALLDAIDNTGVCVFMYYPQTKVITVPKNACEAYHCKAVYENMPQSFADDFVYEEDYRGFNEMYYAIDRGEQTASAIFHSKDLNFCCHVTLTTVTWNENGEPEATVGIIENVSEAYKSKTLIQQLQNKISEDIQTDATVQKAVQLIADTVSGEYLTIYHIWLEDMTYVCFQDESTNYAISRGNRIPCVQEHANQYIDEFVKPEYASGLRKFYCFDTLKERLKDTSYVEMVYQTNRNGWTKARYIVAERDDAGNASNVIFTVKDINDDVIREEKKRKTEFELLHDPLTEAYNRKAFDEMEASENNNGKPTGFAIIDIDNFKIVNDVFGHEVGDKVLVEAAKLLKSALRPDDLVFRIGGDEFAVLLRNCKPSAWKPLCEKQHQVHAALNQLIDGTSVTLSIGIVFSSNGYNADVFRQADEQLYEVKHRGRAGAGMLDLATGQVNYWRDDALSYEAQNDAESRKSIESLYNNVPGGIVIYEWDGKKLSTIHLSAYYEKAYGYTLNTDEDGDRVPDYKCVHPDDLADYQKAISIALSDTHELHYEFRIWNQSRKQYIWTHIDATIQVQENGTLLVFALYTDVTERKEAKLAVDKRQASLEAALAVSDQICCEYDPQTHIIECQNADNYLKLPKVAENYPDCMRGYNIIHPKDIELFMQTVHAFDGTKAESCTLRCLKNGEYRWFTCTFSPYYDQEKGRNIAILIIQDATHRMETMHSYEDRLRSLLAANKNALSICTINVSQDTFEMLGVDNTIKQFVNEKASFETVMLSAADSIIGEDAQKAYRELFCRENLLKQAAEGNMHLQMEYLLNVSEKHYEWITATVDLIRNPITEDIVGVAYSNVTGTQRMKSALLDKSLHQDYLFAAIIFTDTDEFYLYDPIQKKFGEHMTDYWDVAIKDAKPRCSQKTYQYLEEMVSKERVLSQLKTETDYSFSYDSSFGGQDIRLEIRYCYADEAKTMILASMRNITDFALLERCRYDSEHDPLTGLYNRNTTFRKCREMLDAHPDDQFVMVHADVRHFKLYNTFFGEAAGDQLLCDAADLFRWMDADYDYWVYGRIDADVLCAFFPYDQARYQKHISHALKVLKNYRADYLVEPVIGMYFVADRSMPIDAMFTRATLAAKAVKPETQYATVVYDETLEQKLTEEQQVLNDMQTAINEKQFEVYLQPKYSLRTNKPVGAEALVRWMHPKKGMISPGTFIPVFESNGFITTLDRYMWEHVCHLLSNWKKEGKPLAPVSVNVSRLSMFGSTTVDFLKDLVNKYNIEPKYLELELTESAFMDDPEEMQLQMQALKDAGFTILLDDFGSGYSSLNTLRDIPVDVLKMDMKFLSLNTEDLRGGLVISSIIRMAKLLNLIVIAEGVETPEQAEYLKEVGCEYVQGYLFARPMPVADYEKILMDKDKPLSHVKQPMIDHIGRIVAETGSGTYAMGTVIPVPMACIEYSEGSFSFLRVNPYFYSEFNLDEDLQPASQVFKKRLTERSLARLIQAFEESTKNNKKSLTPIVWNAIDGTRRKYTCHIAYEGSIGNSSAIVVVFSQVMDGIQDIEG